MIDELTKKEKHMDSKAIEGQLRLLRTYRQRLKIQLGQLQRIKLQHAFPALISEIIDARENIAEIKKWLRSYENYVEDEPYDDESNDDLTLYNVKNLDPSEYMRIVLE